MNIGDIFKCTSDNPFQKAYYIRIEDIRKNDNNEKWIKYFFVNQEGDKWIKESNYSPSITESTFVNVFTSYAKNPVKINSSIGMLEVTE